MLHLALYIKKKLIGEEFSLTIIIKSKTRPLNKIAKGTNGFPGRMVSIHHCKFICRVNAGNWNTDEAIKGLRRLQQAGAALH